MHCRPTSSQHLSCRHRKGSHPGAFDKPKWPYPWEGAETRVLLSLGVHCMALYFPQPKVRTAGPPNRFTLPHLTPPHVSPHSTCELSWPPAPSLSLHLDHCHSTTGLKTFLQPSFHSTAAKTGSLKHRSTPDSRCQNSPPGPQGFLIHCAVLRFRASAFRGYEETPFISITCSGCTLLLKAQLPDQ